MNNMLLYFFAFGTIVMLVFSGVFLLLELCRIKNPFKTYIKKFQNQIAFFVAIGATAGSVLLSALFQFPPCELCWYQRIFMFPIPIITFFAVATNDLKARTYTFV